MSAKSNKRSRGDVRIGISGWRYAGWRGKFYPNGLPRKQELAYAADCFSTIELNGSFYSLQRPENYAHWYEETPDDFLFAVKGSRFITHMLRLRDSRTALANFFASGLVVAETAGKWPLMEDVTADFVYVRLHGDRKIYESGYSGAALDRWARRIEAWRRGGQPSGAKTTSTKPPPRRSKRDVYVYFDNDIKVHAPADAARLEHKLRRDR